jgi:hypothetical protein
MRRIFGSKKDEGRKQWIKLHNGEIMVCAPHPILFG